MKQPLQGGGFFSLGRYLDTFGKLDEGDRDLKELTELIGKLPNKGRSPVFVIFGGAGGPTPSMAFETVVEKAWLDDVGAGLSTVIAKELKVAAP